MGTEAELSKQSVPIIEIPKYFVDWVIKVFVIRRGSIIPYKTSRHNGTFRTILLVDEEVISFLLFTTLYFHLF